MRVSSRRLSRLVAMPVLAVAVAGAAPAVASAACAGAGAGPAELGHPRVAKLTLCLVNRQRAAHGLRPLRLDGKLSRAARGHSADMVAHRYFAHDSLTGASFSARIARTGWMHARRSWTVGENIGWGTGRLASPRGIVRAWMHSAPHRANILQGRFRMIGIGVACGAPAQGVSRAATYSTDFGG